MRVLQIITRLIVGGAQQHVVSLARLLRDRHGWDVAIASGPPLGPEGDLTPVARAAGLPLLVLPVLQREVDVLRDFRAFEEVRSAIARFRPDVVHTHSAKAGVVGRLAARAACVPVVVHTYHGLPFFPGQTRATLMFFTALERTAARCAVRHICVSDHVRQDAQARGILRNRDGIVIPCGVDTEFWMQSRDRDKARRHFGLGDGPVFACIARLAPHKGHALLLQAAGELPEAEWLFVGDGRLRSWLEAAARGRRVRFTGLLDPEGVAQAIAAADVVVHTAAVEALGLALVQAVLAGRPVVALDRGGPREVIQDGVSGVLVRDPRRLPEALRRARQMRVPAAARERLARQFDEHSVADRVGAVYRELLATKSSGEHRRRAGAGTIGNA